MLLKRPVVGLFALASLAFSADAASFKLIRQGGTDALDAAASATHGHIKWSHGAFLYVDYIAGIPPYFLTLDREGKLISSATLSMPALVRDFDRAADGSIVLAGVTSSSYGEQKPFLAWIAADGKTERNIPMSPYYPSAISLAPDGTLWTLGFEMINHDTHAPELNPDAGVMRHYDRGGTLINWYLPQGSMAKDDFGLIQEGRLVATGDRLGWYASIGRVSKYVEISLDTMKERAYAGLPPSLSGVLGGYIEGLALTDAGDVTVCVPQRNPYAPSSYRFDRTAAKWTPLPVPSLGGYRYAPRLLGSDGEDLVFQYDQSAAFFSVVSNGAASAVPLNPPLVLPSALLLSPPASR